MELLADKKILVVVAHPDDELLGPGATLHKLASTTKSSIRVVILGEGITSRSDTHDTERWKTELEEHRQNIVQAQKRLGYESLSLHHFPDNRFDRVDLLDIIKVVEKEIQSFGAEVILTHHGGDVNIDHQLTFRAAITATRPVPGEKVTAVVTFETPSGTEWIPASDPRQFVPNYFVEVREADIQAKIEAMECYEFEKRAWPHPRSPEALRIRARYRGSTVGRNYAEAFQVIRLIQ